MLISLVCTFASALKQLVPITTTQTKDHPEYQILQVGSNISEDDLENRFPI